MTGHEKDYLELKKKQVRALEKANKLKIIELEIQKINTQALLTNNQVPLQLGENLLTRLNEIKIR